MPSCRRPSSMQALAQHAHSAGAEHIGRVEAATGLEVGEERCLRGDFVEILQRERDTGIGGDREKMQHGVGGAAGRGDTGDGIVQRFACDDLFRANVFFQEAHHELAAIEGDFAFARIGGGNFVCAHRRNSEEGDRGGHGVGGELAAARAGAGTGFVFEFAELLDGHLAGSAGADGFEDVQNGDVAAVVVSGENRAAVERKRRDIQARESHHGAGDGLIAAADRDDGVEGVGAHEKLDGIGDHFARNQRSFHAFGAHGDAVGNGDGVELDGSAAGGADAGFDAFGELAQMKIAGSDFGPGVGDGDERAGEIVVGEARGFEHGPGGGAREAFFDDVTLHDDLGSPLGRINQKSPVTVDSVRGAAPRDELGGWPAPDNYYD